MEYKDVIGEITDTITKADLVTKSDCQHTTDDLKESIDTLTKHVCSLDTKVSIMNKALITCATTICTALLTYWVPLIFGG